MHLTRRERQIMDSLYERGEATVSEVLDDLPDAPSYSAVRAMLRKLEEKGHLEHDARGPRYVYRPTLPREAAQDTAVQRLVRTFFEGSPSKMVAAILDSSSAELTEEELDELSALIEQARRRGR
ncbi:MAG: BlaI/MecI/CopY family transcriptional regulator [Gemmatimonadetes bacterium]|nr:BlaI/MecI/CopY family transcriptional regulator [Gemmatimonadota bacterium]